MTLYGTLKNVVGYLKSVNSYSTLYEESLREIMDSEILDEIIIESRNQYHKFKKLADYCSELEI